MSEPHFPVAVTLRPSRPRTLAPADAEPVQSRHTYKETHRTGPVLPQVSVPSWVAAPLWGCLLVVAVAATVKLVGVLF